MTSIDIQQQLNALVARFVADATALAQQAATLAVQQAFTASQAKLSAQGLSAAARLAGKRSGKQLDGIMEQFRDYVAANPGQRIEEINRALGTSTKDLQLPIRKLIATGRIYTRGSRRVTQYFAKKKV